MDSIKRRRLLALTATGATGLATGCVGNGDGGEDDGNETNGGDGGSDGDDGEGTGDSDGGNDAGAEDVSLGDSFEMNEAFAFETERTGDQGGTLSGRFRDGNVYVEIQTEQGTSEFYNIDGDQYFVMNGGRCIRNPGENMSPDDGGVNPEEYENDVQEYSDLSPTETTTIDGEEVYVFEIPGASDEGSLTYYVGVDSGNLRRVNSSGTVTNFHSWGDVEPVEAPDMECQDMSDMSTDTGA